MTLLLPELERQLRQAAQRRVADVTAPDGRRVGPRRRLPIGGLVAASVAALSVLVAVAVLALVHHGSGAPPAPARVAPAGPVAVGNVVSAPDCPGARPARQRVASVVAVNRATGYLPWRLIAFANPRSSAWFELDGHAFALCPPRAQLHLVNAPGRGVAFGYLPGRLNGSWSVSGISPQLQALGTGALFNVRLDHPACRYHALIVSVGRARLRFDLPRCPGRWRETVSPVAKASGAPNAVTIAKGPAAGASGHGAARR